MEKQQLVERIRFLEIKNKAMEEVVEYSKQAMATVVATETKIREEGDIDCLIDEYKRTVDQLVLTHRMYQADKLTWETYIRKGAYKNRRLCSRLYCARQKALRFRFPLLRRK
jgi:hypothetical protein